MLLLDESGSCLVPASRRPALFHEDADSERDPPRYHLACRPGERATACSEAVTGPTRSVLPGPGGPFFRRLTGDGRIVVIRGRF
ncbi:hypothetical protein E3T48_12905 [Cryobacterium fucosi]|uniref:Uncharacterized protein n=1 Tax=Cryobacterium fucosi TaxID=1259157 RepID=A0A4R9B5A8_9MICO|nr:hypothetical protein E3T48_12905 [Cryobacterium fucosi]